MKFFRLKPRGIIRLVGYSISYGNIDLLYNIFNEIFVNCDYAFNCSSDSPLIVDAGANIGIATLFFKYRHRQSKIICFEPDTTNFRHLQYNVRSNALANVELHNVALYDRDGSVCLFVRSDVEGGDIGASVFAEHRYYFHDKKTVREVAIPCEKLSKYLENEDGVDLLKLDIEGAECVVLQEIEKHLPKIRNIILEYHFIEGENPLPDVLRLLNRNDFDYSVHGLSRQLFPGSTLLIRSKNTRQPLAKLPVLP